MCLIAQAEQAFTQCAALGPLRCTEPRRAEAPATLQFQVASASSSNATATRRMADSSTASS